MENLTINNILKFYENKVMFPEVYVQLIMKWKSIKSKGTDNTYYILGEFPITLDTVINAEILQKSQNKFIENRKSSDDTKTQEILQNDIDEYTSFITIMNSLNNGKKIKLDENKVLSNELRQALGAAVHFNLPYSEEDSEEETISTCCPMWYNPTYNEPEAAPISGAGRGYICYNGMDDNNKKAMDIQATEGWDAAIKHMITGSDGKPRSYAEMRELYG